MSEFTGNISMLSNILEKHLLIFKEPPVTGELPAVELLPKRFSPRRLPLKNCP